MAYGRWAEESVGVFSQALQKVVDQDFEDPNQVVVVLVRLDLLFDQDQVVLVEDVLENYFLVLLHPLVLDLYEDEQEKEELAILDSQ